VYLDVTDFDGNDLIGEDVSIELVKNEYDDEGNPTENQQQVCDTVW